MWKLHPFFSNKPFPHTTSLTPGIRPVQRQSSSAALSMAELLSGHSLTLTVVVEVKQINLQSFSSSKFSQLLSCGGKFPKLTHRRGTQDHFNNFPHSLTGIDGQTYSYTYTRTHLLFLCSPAPPPSSSPRLCHKTTGESAMVTRRALVLFHW